MLAIRMQRTGRSGHAQFRVIVQDSRAHPKSGRIVEYLGSYNPHTKVAAIDDEKISQYIKNGAQPSERVVSLLKKEGVKVPKWASSETKKEKAIRNPEKLRRNRPAGEPAPEEAPAAESEVEAPVETIAEEKAVSPDDSAASEEAPATEPPAEAAAKEQEAPVAAETEPQEAEQTPGEDTAAKEPAEENESDQKTS